MFPLWIQKTHDSVWIFCCTRLCVRPPVAGLGRCCLLISDPELTVHRAFRVAYVLDDEERARLEKYGIDLEAASGQDHHTIAIPSVFLVGKDGKVQWVHVERDHRTRPSAMQLLEVIDQRRP